MPTMINLVVFNHSPKFESNYSKYKKYTRFRIKIRIKRNHYLSLDSVQMINIKQKLRWRKSANSRPDVRETGTIVNLNPRLINKTSD